MSDHYYTEKPTSESSPRLIEVNVLGRTFTLYSDSGVFSKSGLDKGTEVLIKNMPVEPSHRVLDWEQALGL